MSFRQIGKKVQLLKKKDWHYRFYNPSCWNYFDFYCVFVKSKWADTWHSIKVQRTSQRGVFSPVWGVPATMFVCNVLKRTNAAILVARVTLRERFTVANGSVAAADDRVQSLSSFIREKNGTGAVGRGQDGAIHLGCNYAQSHRRVSSSYFPLWWDQDRSETDRVMVSAQYELIVSVSVKWQRWENAHGGWTSALMTCTHVLKDEVHVWCRTGTHFHLQ